MATFLAKLLQLFSQTFPTLTVTVFNFFSGVVDQPRSTISPAVISTSRTTICRDASATGSRNVLFKPRSANSIPYSHIPTTNFCPLSYFQTLFKMADNFRRAVQEINLGVEDAPVALPEEIVNQAVAENRFILFGRPVIPRRQNLRSIVASMPQIRGQAEIVHGRIAKGRQLQFVFPTEDALETVLRRGPWAFNDRMLLLQSWQPQMPLLNIIPFWTQIRGIPFQFLNRGVVEHIGRALGQVLDVDFDAEAVARVDYARVLLHWDIAHPLRFQRNFQFTVGVNTLLRFRYKRLRGFCEVCGLLTHDSGACLITNGGEEQHEEDEEEDPHPQARNRNQGVVIREIHDDEPLEDIGHQNNGLEQDGVANQHAIQEDNQGPANVSDDDVLSDIDPNHDALVEYEHSDMFSGERNDSELLNPIPIFENSCGDIPGSPSHRRYNPEIYPLALMDSEGVINPEVGEIIDRGKRKREDSVEEEEQIGISKYTSREIGEGSGSCGEHQCRGAVGPKPPRPP